MKSGSEFRTHPGLSLPSSEGTVLVGAAMIFLEQSMAEPVT